MKTQKKLICVVAFLFFLISSPAIAGENGKDGEGRYHDRDGGHRHGKHHQEPLTCAQLATDPDLVGNPYVFNLTVTQYGDLSPRCEVNFTYSSRGGPKHGYAVGETQQVKIRVGLPLNSVDGGIGGDPIHGEGAWNGRTQGLGGGGCVGTVGSVTSATNAGYVGSSTDTGHVNLGAPTCPDPTNPLCNSCSFALQPDPYRLNIGRLNDFVIDSLIAQVRWSKVIAEIYYDKKPFKNYWSGCSTGGKQGMALAQHYPEELDGWLIGAPGVNYGRFRLSQMWGQIVTKDLLGGPISTAKLNQANASAIAACDGNDGVLDGIITDSRSCYFSATANICGTSTAPPSNCLTPTEAEAIDLMWDGPRNLWGKKVYYALSRGAPLTGWNGATPVGTGLSQTWWNHQDLYFDWKTITMADYGAEAELGSDTNGDIINTMDVKLDRVRDGGKKILMWHGEADNSIEVDNSLNYYIRVASHFGKHDGTPDFGALQSWFRYFRAPGVWHCGNGPGPQPQNLFETMVNWVENGAAPDTILALGGSVSTRTRPLCPFPQKAIYDGVGDPNVASSFHCGGNVQTKEAICAGLVTPYKEETENELQSYGKYNPAACNPHSKVPHP
jgi:hypothetical protein